MKSMNAAWTAHAKDYMRATKAQKSSSATNLTLQPAEYTNSQEVAVLGLDVSIAVLISMMK